MDPDNHYITFHYFKTSKDILSLPKSSSTLLHLYPNHHRCSSIPTITGEKSLKIFKIAGENQRSPEKINDRRRSSTVTGEFQRSPPEIISLKTREFQVCRFFVDFCSGVSLCVCFFKNHEKNVRFG
ncbi:hypothetical protein HanRHA438_Chr12g0550721 [Helianthus annuus]|nr:hypothetical protein HanRHA438_Chr12g0550721 [Helianthus annuus]